MATTANHTPNTLQPRRYSGQKKVNMRGHAEMLTPRTSLYKRTYANGSRNEVKKIKTIKNKDFFFNIRNWVSMNNLFVHVKLEIIVPFIEFLKEIKSLI
jgi:hypothetical protein